MTIHSTPAVGIDLGTTFSLVAHLDSAGRPWTIPNAEGDMLTPSVVLFEGSSVVVGKEAGKAAALEPERIAQFAKRDMGSAVYAKAINGEHLPPEVIQSLILEKLKRDAEAKLRAQQGKRFREVSAHVLVDQQATRAAIAKELVWLSKVGREGE